MENNFSGNPQLNIPQDFRIWVGQCTICDLESELLQLLPKESTNLLKVWFNIYMAFLCSDAGFVDLVAKCLVMACSVAQAFAFCHFLEMTYTRASLNLASLVFCPLAFTPSCCS